MPAYLDHAATTPMRPEAVAAMLPFLTDHFGNPSGSHAVSRRARLALEDAREQMAAALGCEPAEVVFTGGGTEADNLAVLGTQRAAGGVAVCSAVEHHAVLHPVEVTGGVVVPVTAAGIVDLDALADVLASTPDVRLVSVMLANNEVGTVQPLAEVADVAARHAPGARLHTDAVQALLWLDVARLAAAADLVAVAGHKVGGPKGVGALVVREGTPLAPILHGGGQERERRSGTHNIAGIVGMAAAVQATVDEREELVARATACRERLIGAIRAGVPDVVVTAPDSPRIAGNLHVRIPGVESEELLFVLDELDVCASAGSACASGALEPSHVLAAMGVNAEDASSSVRLSLGWPTTEGDIETGAAAVVEAVRRLRR